MKKIITIMIVCLMIACVISGCARTPSIEITDGEIANMCLLNKINNQVNYKYLSESFVEPDLSEQYEKVVVPEEDDEVEKSLLESKIIVEECKSLDILFTMDEAKQTVQTEYEQIKQDTSESKYYNIILSVLHESDITESEYIELMESEAFYKYNKISLKNHFSTKKFDSSKAATLDEQFDEYISKLVSNKG